MTRTCRVCGCTEDEPCVYVDPLDGQPRTCAWVEAELCSACEAVAIFGDPTYEEDPLVQVYTEGEANAAIAAMRRGAL